ALLSGEPAVWTPTIVGLVNAAFNENPDEGPDTFLEKLRRQIADLSDEAKQFAAEVMYVMLLFPSKISAKKKRENVEAILAWRRSPVALRGDLLEDRFLGGVGSTGQGLNQNRPFEFGYLLKLFTTLKALPEEERRRVV